MILHITRALNAFRVLGSFKFAENLTVSFSGDVGQNIKASTVGHRNGNLVEPVFGRGLQNFIYKAHRRFGTF